MHLALQRHFKSIFLVVASFCLCALALGWAFAHLNQASTLLNQYAYYIIFAMTGLWAVQLLPFFKKSLQGNSVPVAICFVMTAFVFLSSPPKYRVLSDETNLLSVSQSMTFRQEIQNVTEGKFYFGNFNALDGGLPTRPLLFPFFTSLIHTATGYRYQNVFVLNFILLWAFLTLIYLSTRSRVGTPGAIAACLLLLSIPALTLSATSGGFDLCSLLFLCLSFVLLYQFLHRPTSANLSMLAIQLLLLSQIRYESIAYVALIGIALLCMRRIRLDMITSQPLVYALAPIFLLPMILTRKLTPNTFENPPGVAPFAFEHFVKHLKVLGDSMIHFQPEYPYPSLLNLLSLLMAGFLVFKLSGRTKLFKSPIARQWTTIVSGTIVLGMVIVLSHHFGYFPHPTQARLFLVFLTSLALIPVAMRRISPQIMTERRLLALAIASFVLYHPVAIQARFPNALTIIRETDEIYRFMKDQPQNALLIVERPGQFTVANRGAIGFARANDDKMEILEGLKKGVFSDIFVVQKMFYETGKPLSDQDLPSEYKLIPIKELMSTGTEFVRISRVTREFYPIQAQKPPLAADLQRFLKMARFKE